MEKQLKRVANRFFHDKKKLQENESVRVTPPSLHQNTNKHFPINLAEFFLLVEGDFITRSQMC